MAAIWLGGEELRVVSRGQPRIQWTSVNCPYISGLMQERHNSIANALELRLSCINPRI